jgi:hypothetical protein
LVSKAFLGKDREAKTQSRQSEEKQDAIESVTSFLVSE